MDESIFLDGVLPLGRCYRLINLAIYFVQLQTRHIRLFGVNTSPNLLQIIMVFTVNDN